MPPDALAPRRVDMSTLTEDPPVQVEIAAEDWRRDRARREWMLIGLALSCLVTLMAIVFAVFAFADGGDRPVARPAAAPAQGRRAGPSIWSVFHVIGTVFDRTVIEGRPGADSQTMNLAPSQGGWAEFTLAEEGSYPFVTHGAGHYAAGQTMPFEVTG
jgi:hypothetical protein